MVHLYVGTMDDYLREVAEQAALARLEAEQQARAETDADLQCGHGISLYRECRACGEEAQPVVRTRRDGFGRWHASISMPVAGADAAEAKVMAERAITRQVALRDEAGPGWQCEVEPDAAPVFEDGRVLLAFRERDVEEHLQPGPWDAHPDCVTCQQQRAGLGGPTHDPSPRCQSGGHPHCTCDTCF